MLEFTAGGQQHPKGEISSQSRRTPWDALLVPSEGLPAALHPLEPLGDLFGGTVRKTPVPDRSPNTPCYKRLGGNPQGIPKGSAPLSTLPVSGAAAQRRRLDMGPHSTAGCRAPTGTGRGWTRQTAMWPWSKGRVEERRADGAAVQLGCGKQGQSTGLCPRREHGTALYLLHSPGTITLALSTEPSWDHAIGFPPSCSMQTPLCIPETCLGTGFL